MAKSSPKKHAKKLTVNILGTLLALGMADQATGGAVQNLVRGQLKAAGNNVAASISDPKASIGRALPFAVGMAAYSVAKRSGFAPTKTFGPLRIGV